MSMIREAEKADCKKVYDLLCLLEEEEFEYSKFTSIYEINIESPDIHYYVHESNDGVDGFISLHVQRLLHHNASVGEIQELILDSSVRGRGIGKQLFHYVENVCRESGVVQIEVCCNQKRKTSHQFYEKMGMINDHYKLCKVLYI